MGDVFPPQKNKPHIYIREHVIGVRGAKFTVVPFTDAVKGRM